MAASDLSKCWPVGLLEQSECHGVEKARFIIGHDDLSRLRNARQDRDRRDGQTDRPEHGVCDFRHRYAPPCFGMKYGKTSAWTITAEITATATDWTTLRVDTWHLT